MERQEKGVCCFVCFSSLLVPGFLAESEFFEGKAELF